MLSYVIDTLQGGECVCQSVGVAFSHHITNSKATALSRKFSWSIASVPKFLEAAYFSTEHLEPTSTLTLRQLPEKNSLKNPIDDTTVFVAFDMEMTFRQLKLRSFW
ncbi:unnamed protein product, partial [Brassica oleracea]